ncbi:MAG: hypothetical protein EZS28_015675 [Streblomastix strix]|uniref:Uncharacterized protein n=1 Tax=Streblomastix strix TaxID=222440 RepID=A0A5J4W1W5_9EUKA|nr:MAG: hypothetical protein EZS28_015675 [Streblomastix strix]
MDNIILKTHQQIQYIVPLPLEQILQRFLKKIQEHSLKQLPQYEQKRPEIELDKVQIINNAQMMKLLYPSCASEAVDESKGLITNIQIICPQDISQMDDIILIYSKNEKDLSKYIGAGRLSRKAEVYVIRSIISRLDRCDIHVKNY